MRHVNAYDGRHYLLIDAPPEWRCRSTYREGKALVLESAYPGRLLGFNLHLPGIFQHFPSLTGVFCDPPGGLMPDDETFDPEYPGRERVAQWRSLPPGPFTAIEPAWGWLNTHWLHWQIERFDTRMYPVTLRLGIGLDEICTGHSLLEVLNTLKSMHDNGSVQPGDYPFKRGE